MKIEEIIECGQAEVKQIKKYDPDPYYVSYFFQSYLNLINMAYRGIFEEADNDFGLFAAEYNRERFKEKSILKNDSKSIKFVSWYEEKIEEEHRGHYPAFMQKITRYYEHNKKLPKVRIGIRAKHRYKNDTFQEIPIKLRNGRLSSKEELQAEVNRQIPIFLEIINYKRVQNNEHMVSRKDIVASAFFESFEDYDIAYAAEVYIQVVKRIVMDSRKKITELSRWK